MEVLRTEDIPWEACAILFTGILAVLGAIVIGLKQVGISQALVRQEQLKLREALFERRFEFLDGFNAYANRIIDEDSVHPDEMAKFLRSVRVAKLIFSAETQTAFLKARDAIARYSAARDDAAARDDPDGLEVREYKIARDVMNNALLAFNDRASAETRLTT